MSEQKDLFGAYGGFPPFQKGSDTSFGAALSVEAIAPNIREKVYDYIKMEGMHGATNYEISKKGNILLQTVCARVAELRECHRVEDSSVRRLTPSGRKSIVWIVTS